MDADYSAANQSDEDQALVKAIEDARSTAYGSETWGDLANQRALAIDFYLGKNTFPAPDGRSQVVDRTVYETIQWIMPSLTRIFANGDDVIDLPPLNQADEPQAEQESQYLNYLILQKNAWFDLFTTAAKDALMTKTGYLYGCRDLRKQVEIEKYERQTAEGIALLRLDAEAEVLSLNEYADDQQPLAQDPQTGQPLPARMLYDLELRRVKKTNVYRIKVLPPDRCLISEKTFEVQLTECPYFEYYEYMTLSELRQEGYEVPDDLAGDPIAETQEDISRDQFSQRTQDWDSHTEAPLKRVRCRYVWIRHDYDDDGIAELQYVVLVGKVVLYREEVNRIPVAVLCPDPLPHRHIGMSVADAVMDIQQIKTVITRGGLDNLYLSNNPRTFANADKINLEDLKISRPGGMIRGKGAIFGQDIAPLETPFVFDKAMLGLQYMDQVRESRTGVNNSFQGLEQNSLSQIQPGTVNQISSMASQRVEQIARTFASGIEVLASILHELALKGGHQKDTVKLSGKWVEIDPATWRSRTDFRIKVGYASANKDAMLSHLSMIAGLQSKALEGGLPIVNAQNAYETATEMTKAAGLTAPQRFWTDPKTVPPPPPPQPDITVMAGEQEKTKRDVAIKQMGLAQQERESQRETALEQYKIDSQNRIELHKTHFGHESALVQQSHGKLLETPEPPKPVEPAEDPHAQTLAHIQGLAQQMGQAIQTFHSGLHSVITAKRTIRRDKSGKPVGIDITGPDGAPIASQKVVRGPDGRVAGVQ